MVNHLWFYSSLPFIAAVICCYLLGKLLVKKSNIGALLLFSNLALLNIIQAALYLALSYSQVIGEYFADAYLITAYFFFAHLTLFAVSLSKKPVTPIKHYLMYVLPGVLTVFHLSGLMVDGYRFEQNALMHNDGPLAWCFDVFALVSCIAAAAILFNNIKANRGNRMLTSKNIIGLISFVPLILAFFIIILLSATPYAFPVVIVGSLITIYTALAFYYLLRDSVVDLSIGLTFFWRRLSLAYLLLETHKTKTDLKTFTKAVEKQFINEALELHKGNIQETADYLGINHTTLRNKIKEYDVISENERMYTRGV